MATSHEMAAKMRSRVAADFWPCVARHSLVTSTSSPGRLSTCADPPSERRSSKGKPNPPRIPQQQQGGKRASTMFRLLPGDVDPDEGFRRVSALHEQQHAR